MTDLSRYIRYTPALRFLQIDDADGALHSLPEDIFLQYPNTQELSITVKNLTVLPGSLFTLQQLKVLSIRGTKVKAIPAEIVQLQQLESIDLSNGNMDLNKGLPLLAKLPALRKLSLYDWRGYAFPENIYQLKNLTQLVIQNNKMTGKVKEILALQPAIPALRELRVAVNQEDYTQLLALENMPQLDKLDLLGLWHINYWNLHSVNSALSLAVTKHVNMYYDFSDSLPAFRHRMKGKTYNASQLQLLFALHVEMIAAINQLLPNLLAQAIADKKQPSLYLMVKPKGESQKSINEKLEKYGISVNSKQTDANTIVVIGPGTTIEELMPLLDAGCQVITVDQLSEILIGQGDHWLLQDDNEAANTQLMRLFASNDPDNYRLAFEIIETGGANKIIQTLLAVVMLAHPDKTIHKKAEKLYDKYGSQAFRQYIKSNKISLRVGGNVNSKLQRIVVNKDDVDEVMFRLMYQLVAGSNNNISKVRADAFSMKGIANITLPPEVAYFTQITDWDFENCEGFNIEAAIPVFQEMTNMKYLRLNSCHIQIPASINTLTQLERLEIAHNTLAVEDSLQSLVHLQYLDATGLKLQNWDWLQSLKGLQTLMLSNNQLTAIPAAVFNMQQLSRFEVRYNKLTTVPETLGQLPKLEHLDFSNNLIKTFPYFLGKYKNSTLLLRSNKIPEMDPHQLMAATGGQPVVWTDLNLSRNLLKQFEFTGGNIKVDVLDISHNQLTVLHPSVFEKPMSSFYGHHNQISILPQMQHERFRDFWMQHNLLEELPAHLSHARIENADFSHNRISSVHPHFEIYGNENYSRLYWKVHNNPLPPGKIGGMYLR
ncbi:leucine-rich repeat domain-containing protein [Chitinophaga qingshengii]|uniref:Leucine-rich repeat protein n=1 Tax=Chitinophaga qingshengii TaxID=1569794 RepID=A0ABR7TQR1_9BACT|nr:leucine-rich repeat protein [Chitinophaga qingshengii]MBC9931841.1 leucine-rich repeat protein [Chitinophaga qingshengii]